MQQDGIALWRKSIFVRVHADTGNTGEAEIKTTLFLVRRWEASLLQEANNKRSQAAVNVKRNLVGGSKMRQRRNIVDNAMGEVWCRANEKNGVGVDQPAHGGDIDLVLRVWTSHGVEFDFEVSARLVECGMSGVRDDSVTTVSYFFPFFN